MIIIGVARKYINTKINISSNNWKTIDGTHKVMMFSNYRHKDRVLTLCLVKFWMKKYYDGVESEF